MKSIINFNKTYINVKNIYNSKNSNVYIATNKSTNKLVIFKTLDESIGEHSDFSKLHNEYKILLKINSEFIPKPIEYSKIGDRYYLIKEYCQGVTLLEYIQQNKMEVKEFLNIAIQIVCAISEIHSVGIIHKDINPSNIVYNNKTGKISIIDFGMSSEFAYEKSLNINLNVSEGTLYYMSPEQTGRMNHVIDFRSDFYSLGVTFFEILCGCCPFESERPTQIIYMHLAKIPPTAKEVNQNVPEMLSRIISKLLAKMPEDRYLKAEGILFDLNKCLELLDSSNDIKEFALGNGDYSDRFEIPKKLYGRDSEISFLRTAYSKILNGEKKLTIISGHSGSGKTSLVKELYKPIANSNGIFIYGKFDQYHKNIPYSAILQAIEQLCDFILSEDEKSIEIWKNKFTAVFNQDSKLLTDKIPKLALIVGDSKKQTNLSPIEEQTKFKAIFQNFLAIIASADNPLVIFIDDIHHADIGSLEIIEEILRNEKIKGLQIVICYRDNEVDDNHPLILSINKMIIKQINIQQLSLVGLTFESMTQMVANALHHSIDSVIKLTHIIYNKTNGNPFYIRSFLKLCNRKGYIYFDYIKKAWNWNIDEVSSCPAEENVIDFLVRNINQLPSETINLLSIGSCIGQVFDVDTLFAMTGKTIELILEDLKHAVALEIVYPLKNNSVVKNETDFYFSHDRFQQTFYTVLTETEKYNLHYNLALYYEKLGYENNNNIEELFTMTDNYSIAFNIIESKKEKRRISEILIKAAHKASLTSSFDTAIRYLEQIINNLEYIELDKNFIFSLYVEYHSVLCSTAKYDQADEIYTLLENLKNDPISLTDSCCMQAISLSNRGKYKDAFMLGINLAEKLGIHFPIDNLLNTIIKEIDVFYTELNNENFQGIEKLPKSENIYDISIGKILNRICTAGFFYNPLWSFWAIITCAKRVLKNGYTPEGLSLYGSLTLLLIPFRNDYKSSYSLALSAMKLAEFNGYRVFRMYHLFSLINCHWFNDLKDSISYARESRNGNISVGDFEFACFTYFTTQQVILETSENVDELVMETNSALAFAKKHGNAHAYKSFLSFRQFTKSLINKSLIDGSFNDDNFNELNYLNDISTNNMALCFFYTLRALSATIFLDFDKAFELTEKAIPLMSSVTGFYLNSLHNFIHSLSICKKIENEKYTKEEEHSLFHKLEVNQKWLKERAIDAPSNFQHLYDLIEAERYMLENNSSDSLTVYKKVLSLYEKAMMGAMESNKFYQYALICELALIQFIKMGSPRSATVYLKESYSAYLSWGATAKAEQMSQKYSELRRSRFNNLKFKESHNTIKRVSNSNNDISEMFSNNLSMLDFSAIVKASQAISGETKLESILEKLVVVLLENSGAQDIYYLIKKENNYFIEAEGHSESKTISVLENKPIDINKFPMKIINYVERTHENIIIDDGAILDMYGKDQYFSSHYCKSVMCMAVINKGILRGILYLENALVEGVFDKQRSEALKTIASQFAISLENAYLINNLEQLVKEKTAELRREVEIRKDAELFLDTLIETVPIPIFSKNMEGKYTRINKSFEEFFGKNRISLLGKSVFDTHPQDLAEIYHEKDLEILNTFGIQEYENKIANSKGELKNVIFHKSSIIDKNNNINGLVGAVLDITDMKRVKENLEKIAHYDPLTNLPNRRMFQTYLDHSIELTARNKTILAVLFIDLDGFKKINDKYGHDKGDIVLVTTSERLRDSVRSCDTVSRMGGDEFVIILENIKNREEIETVCNRIISSVEMPIEFKEINIEAFVTSSIGIAILGYDGFTSEELITNSDKAMYVAKNNGKNQFVFNSKEYV